MMNRIMQSSILLALLVLNLGAQAGPPPPPNTTPPGFDQTQIIGGKIKAAEPNITGWEKQLTGEAANYNAYTAKLDDNALVVKFLKACQDPAFTALKKTNFQCNFAQAQISNELLASTLLGPLAYSDENERKAAMKFVNNLTNMVPMAYPGDSTVFKDPNKKEEGLTDDGIAYFAKMFKQIPLLSVTQNSLLSLFADRDRLPGFSTGLPATVGKEGAASLLEVLEYEATRRYTNATWFSGMDAASDSATLHEMAYMMAFQNYLMVKSYEQNSRIEALMAAQVSALNNMGSMLTQGGGTTETKAAKKSMDKFQ